MKSKWLSSMVVGLLGSICALTAFGQVEKTPTLGKYLISAKAGGVNEVQGNVTVARQAGTSGILIAGDEVLVGDKVATGDDGMAEVLLNPGSFLRIGHNTSFEFGSTDLEDLKLNLHAGSAVLELYASDDFKVSVRLPQSQIQLTRSGVFRIDVMSDGSAKLTVLKGKALVGPSGTTTVNAGRFADVTPGGVSVSKFDKSSLDSLDVWSKNRSKELASANDHLQRDSLRNSLLSSYNNGGWNIYDSFGLWVRDPRVRGWSFLPFGYGWSSPYGWDYGWGLWRCDMPNYIWMPTFYPGRTTIAGGSSQPGPVVGSTQPGSGGNPPSTTAHKIGARREPSQPPPFQRVEQTTRVESNNVGIRNTSPPEARGREMRSRADSESFPSTVSSPSVSAPASVAAPARVETKTAAPTPSRVKPIDQ